MYVINKQRHSNDIFVMCTPVHTKKLNVTCHYLNVSIYVPKFMYNSRTF